MKHRFCGTKPGLIAACCLFLAGCDVVAVGDSEMTFRYARWLPISIFLLGVLLVPAGKFVRKRYDHNGGWGIILAGPIVAFVFAPTLFLTRMNVRDDGFVVRGGIWGRTVDYDVAFDSVQSYRMAEEESEGRSSTKTEVIFFQMKSGEVVRCPLNNDVMSAGGQEVLRRATARGLRRTADESVKVYDDSVRQLKR